MIRVLLGALVDRDLARVPLEPHLHDKRLLAQHAHENAQSLVALGGPAEGRAPRGDLRAQLVAAASAAEPTEQIALQLRRQQRHALELPPRLIEPPADSTPARDPFVELGPERPGAHAELNRMLIVAEAAAATAVDAPFETKLALAALAAARLDATAAIEATLEQPWGSEPVDLSAYERLMALPAGDRIEQLLGEGRGRDEDPGV